MPEPKRSPYAKQSSKATPIMLSVAAVLAVAAGVVFWMVRDDGTDVSGTINDKTPTTTPKSDGGTTGGPDTVNTGPASRFAPFTGELPGRYSVNVPETFAQNISTFASSYLFKSANEGADYARTWKIIDGYKVQFDPDGLAAGTVQGRYGVAIETYLFEDTTGSKAAYDYIAGVLTRTSGSVAQDAKQLANQSSGYQIIQGTVGTSDMVQVYHRFLFRRGNVVVSVQTVGGQPFMTIDKARDIAVIIDDRILGKREATTPTPIPTPSFNLPPTPEPTR